jgi:hypothetical protein
MFFGSNFIAVVVVNSAITAAIVVVVAVVVVVDVAAAGVLGAWCASPFALRGVWAHYFSVVGFRVHLVTCHGHCST